MAGRSFGTGVWSIEIDSDGKAVVCIKYENSRLIDSCRSVIQSASNEYKLINSSGYGQTVLERKPIN